MGVLCMLIHFERLGFPVASRLRLDSFSISILTLTSIERSGSRISPWWWSGRFGTSCGAAAAAEDAQICFEYQLQL